MNASVSFLSQKNKSNSKLSHFEDQENIPNQGRLQTEQFSRFQTTTMARGKRQRLISSILLINFTLMSSLYLRALTINIFPGLTKEQYNNLPIYCKPSTGYFECKNYTSRTTYCLPQSLKCRVDCSNNDELKCPGFGANTNCSTSTQFYCGDPSVPCIEDHLVCDGREHCPRGTDESIEICKSRKCSGSQFACAKSPGRCLPKTMQCDGNFDCGSIGLADYSDELNCTDLGGSSCRPGEFHCPGDPQTGQHEVCLVPAYVCDRYKDCLDGSDEANCPPETCDNDEFYCDGRCLKASQRCDGNFDCLNGIDELGCGAGKCQFHSEFHCRFSNDSACAPSIFVCDGAKDCRHGEDEICRIEHASLCLSNNYWTCRSGKHCVRLDSVCDGLLHCPDGSDEDACQNRTTIAPSDLSMTTTSPSHQRPQSPRDECRDVFGACDQLCQSRAASSGSPSFTCSCLPGYKMSSDEVAAGGRKGICRAVGAAKLLLAAGNGIHVVDFETTRIEKIAVSGAELSYPKFLEFDVPQKLIFFHTRDGLVGHLRLGNPSGQVTILKRNADMDALAYDWTRRLLFFTVPEQVDGSPADGGYVGVMDSQTGRYSVLKRLSCPRGLALHPELGLLYVSLWCGPHPGVYSMRMDGSEIKPLVTNSLSAPGHLALDTGHETGNQRLYWLDTKLRGIYTCRVSDGGDLRAVWHMGQGYNGLPLGLSVFEDRVIWSDLRAKAVFAIDKFSGGPLHLVSPGPSDEAVLSAVFYHSVRQPGLSGSKVCTCPGHICINLQHPASPSCLCDQEHVMVHGVCVANSLTADNRSSNTGSAALAVVASGASDDRSSANRGAVVAVCVSVTLGIALLVGGFVAFACLRRSGKLSRAALLSAFSGGSSACTSASGSESSTESQLGFAGTAASVGVRGHAGMTKVNSRTPLTECEIGMEDQNC